MKNIPLVLGGVAVLAVLLLASRPTGDDTAGSDDPPPPPPDDPPTDDPPPDDPSLDDPPLDGEGSPGVSVSAELLRGALDTTTQATPTPKGSPREEAEADFASDRVHVRQALSSRFDDAAQRKGYQGWPKQASDKLLDRGKPPLEFSQREVWWVVMNALGDLYNGTPFDDDIDVGFLQWVRGVDQARGLVTHDAWFTGKAMAMAMAMVSATPDRVGIYTPDWSLYA